MKRLVCLPWLLRPPVERSPTVRLFSGREADSSTKSWAVWKRRPADVGLYFFTGMSSDSLEELDGLLAGPLDLDLVGPAVHLEADRVGGLLESRGLLGDQRAADQLQRFHLLPQRLNDPRQ